MEFDLARLRAERVAKGYTQAEFANKIGMHRVTYAKKELGIGKITTHDLEKIVVALGYSKNDMPIFFK